MSGAARPDPQHRERGLSEYSPGTDVGPGKESEVMTCVGVSVQTLTSTGVLTEQVLAGKRVDLVITLEGNIGACRTTNTLHPKGHSRSLALDYP